jgi:hypothetical protein
VVDDEGGHSMTVGSGLSLSDDETEQRPQNFVLRQLIEGRSNAVGQCTLAANAASTTVPAINCGANSAVFLFPRTAHAAAISASTYVSGVSARQFVVTHPNNANTDKDFYFVCLG